MVNKISVVMLTKNSSQHLPEVLGQLKSFDEVIILDNGSTDHTIEIAKRFENIIVHKHKFIGFGPLKQLAVSFTKNEWVLSIDSDEILEDGLIAEISAVSLDPNTVYAIKRDNYYQKKLIRCCGWQNDYVLRLFNKTKVDFNNKQVHESLMTDHVNIEKLNNVMRHYSFKNVEELLSKMQHYSTLYAKENSAIKTSSAGKAFSRAIFSFFKNYILQKGFLYGYEGLIISVSNANGVFYKYIKLMEENQK